MHILSEDQPTTAVLIHAEAELIRRNGWAPHDAGEDTNVVRPTLVTGAAWVIAGAHIAPCDLNAGQARVLGTVLTHLEAALGCSIHSWEQRNTNYQARDVANRLDTIATAITRKATA